MAQMSCANSFILSLDGKPSFNRGDEYIQDLLNKGNFSLTAELGPSVPLAERFIDTVQECNSMKQPLLCNIENESQYFQRKVYPNASRKKSRSVMILVEPEKDKDYCHHLLFACTHVVSSYETIPLVLSHCREIDLNTPLPNCANNQGFTPLGVASLSNNIPACESLIKAGADVNQLDYRGFSPLHWAALGAHLSTVKLLLANGARQNQGDSKGLTPVHYGCISGIPQIVSVLLKESPSSLTSSQFSPSGVAPVILACVLGHSEMVKMLMKWAGHRSILDRDEHGMSSLHYAAWGGSVKCVKILAGCSSWREGITHRDKWGRSPLIIAAAKGNPTVCQLLLKKGAKLHEVDDEGRGVLHWAILSGQLSCVKFLLGHKSGLELCSQQTNEGASPLHYAAVKRDELILASVLERSLGGVPSPTLSGGMTPLIWAASCGKLSCVQLLLEAKQFGDDDDDGGGNKYQPLHAAASVGALEICQALLAAGYKVDGVCSEGLAPLHYASRHGHTECVKMFLSHGETVDRLTGKQESALHLAAMHGHSDTVSELLERGASRDSGDQSIHLACMHGHVEVIQVLLNDGASVDQSRGSDGYTPLYIAAFHGHLSCCEELVRRGANTNIRMSSTNEGLTALDVAMKNGHPGCVSYLISCHAPSGGGVYHRAAATIQAVWRYHRYKRRLCITQHWSASIIQRYIGQWLRRIKASKLRQARIASRHRAASKIQRRWRHFISLKRRYEATYSRLKARLMQEQLATTQLVTELQIQAHSLSLPSVVHHAARKTRPRNAPSVIVKSRSKYLLKSSRPGLSSRPTLPPNTKVTPNTKRLSGNIHSQEPNEESEKKSCLPPVPLDHTSLTTPTEVKKQDVREEDEDVREEDVREMEGTPSPAITSTGVEKLPAIPKTSRLVSDGDKSKESAELPHSDVSAPDYGKESYISSPKSHRQSDGGGTESFLKLPPLTQLNLIRRSSTFKNTPLGYRPFVSRRTEDQSLGNMRLDYGKIHEFPKRINFSNDTELIASSQDKRPQDHQVQEETPEYLQDSHQAQEETPDDLQDSHQAPEETPDDASEDHLTAESEKDPTNKEESFSVSKNQNEKEREKKVLNQIERFERLTRVLDLVRQAKESTGGGGGGGGGEGIEGLKNHIMLALDEAVRLRMETTAEVEDQN